MGPVNSFHFNVLAQKIILIFYAFPSGLSTKRRCSLSGSQQQSNLPYSLRSTADRSAQPPNLRYSLHSTADRSTLTPNPCYSLRSAVTGSLLAARRAGSRPLATFSPMLSATSSTADSGVILAEISG